MIIKSRLFERREPNREAKSFYIFCEGNKREYKYFCYFKEIDSKINVEVIRPEHNENNSPTGLFEKACSFLLKSEENPSPKFELLSIDEVWFVIDTDTWGNKITELRANCKSQINWYIAQSNPCFEVWFYYHFKEEFPNFERIEVSKHWKNYIDSVVIPGGFDSRKHPIYIQTAIQYAEKNHLEETAGLPKPGCTEMFRLGKNLCELIKNVIEEGLQRIE